MTQDALPPIDKTAACTEYRRVLDDIVADEVDAVTLARAESHLAQCAGCRFALAQARAYRRMMRRVGHGSRAPGTLRERAVGMMRDARDQRGPQP